MVSYSAVDYWPLNTALYVVDFHGNDPRFAYYLLRQFDFSSHNSGSAQPSLNRNFIHPLPIEVPPLQEQRAIAHILGSLDDKIDLNRRTNETLEALARAIFKSWFVDFDPVRAKMEGRRPVGMDSETAALFPDRMQESEIGEVPAGWRVAGLDEIADFLNGLALQKYPAGEDGSLPVIKIAQLRGGNVAGADRASAGIPLEYVVEDGDVLFSWSGSLLVDVWCGGRGALNQHLFKVTSKEVPKWFFLQAILEHLPWFQSIAADKATTMGHIQRRHVTEAKMAIPPLSVMKAADRRLAPLLDAMIAYRKEARTLAALRDALLPQLLSGDVRVDLHGGRP